MVRLVLRAVAIGAVLLTLGGTEVSAGGREGMKAYRQGNYARALWELRPLAQRGHPIAQAFLGRMYMTGRGVQRDDTEAVKWLRRAAQRGSMHAQNWLGAMYFDGRGLQRDYVEAAKWYRRAGEQGDANGQFNLGTMYAEGQGVPQNNVEAYKWSDLAAAGTWAAARSRSGKDFSSVLKNLHNLAIKNRDAVAKRMTPAQIAKARRLVREWSEKRRRKK